MEKRALTGVDISVRENLIGDKGKGKRGASVLEGGEMVMAN